MGGQNESVLKPDEKTLPKEGSVLPTDPPPNPGVLEPDTEASSAAVQSDPTEDETPPAPPQKVVPISEAVSEISPAFYTDPDDLPRQIQRIRQHVSGGHCHFHDDDSKLKASIPVADWYNALRNLRNLQEWSFLDPEFGTVITFTPYVYQGHAEVVVDLQKISVGPRFEALTNLAKTR